MGYFGNPVRVEWVELPEADAVPDPAPEPIPAGDGDPVGGVRVIANPYSGWPSGATVRRSAYTGWRVWDLVQTADRVPVLCSWDNGDRWDGPVKEADTMPVVSLGEVNAGLRAPFRAEQIHHQLALGAAVYGELSLFGQVVVHEAGYTAEYARIDRLYLRPCVVDLPPPTDGSRKSVCIVTRSEHVVAEGDPLEWVYCRCPDHEDSLPLSAEGLRAVAEALAWRYDCEVRIDWDAGPPSWLVLRRGDAGSLRRTISNRLETVRTGRAPGTGSSSRPDRVEERLLEGLLGSFDELQALSERAADARDVDPAACEALVELLQVEGQEDPWGHLRGWFRTFDEAYRKYYFRFGDPLGHLGNLDPGQIARVPVDGPMATQLIDMASIAGTLEAIVARWLPLADADPHTAALLLQWLAPCGTGSTCISPSCPDYVAPYVYARLAIAAWPLASKSREIRDAMRRWRGPTHDLLEYRKAMARDDRDFGRRVAASCSCGYWKEVHTGRGAESPPTICLFPILCRSCGTLEEANVLERPISCPSCQGSDVVPYDSPETIGDAGNEEVAGVNTRKKLFRDLVLTDGKYFCPSCRQMRLTFECIGNFDY